MSLRQDGYVYSACILCHFNKLADDGLIEKRQLTERGQEGLYTYYQTTVFGNGTLTEGVDELIHGEQEFEAMYGSSTKN